MRTYEKSAIREDNAFIHTDAYDNADIASMPKWKADAKEFSVSVTYNEEKGSQIRVPKPLLEKLGNPEKIKFVIGKNDKIEVEALIEQALEEREKDLAKTEKILSKRKK